MIYLSESDVPQYYKDIIKLKCDYCGSDIIVSENYKTIRCSNPYCHRKLAGSIKKIIDTLGIKSYGLQTIMEMINNHNYTYVTDFLEKPPIELREDVRNLLSSELSFSEAVKLISLPGLQEKALKIFNFYHSYNDFLRDVEENFGDVFSVISKHMNGFIDILNMMDLLYFYEQDLFNLDYLFKYKEEEKIDISLSINICMTGYMFSVVVAKMTGISKQSKELYLKSVNQLFNEYGVVIRSKKSITSDTDFVIQDTNEMTSKSKTGKARGILISSDDLICILHNHIKGEK